MCRLEFRAKDRFLITNTVVLFEISYRLSFCGCLERIAGTGRKVNEEGT